MQIRTPRGLRPPRYLFTNALVDNCCGGPDAPAAGVGSSNLSPDNSGSQGAKNPGVTAFRLTSRSVAIRRSLNGHGVSSFHRSILEVRQGNVWVSGKADLVVNAANQLIPRTAE